MTQQDIEARFEAALKLLRALQDEPFPNHTQPRKSHGPMMQACATVHALVAELAPRDATFLPQLARFMEDIPQHGMTRPSQCRGVIEAAKGHFVGSFHKIRQLAESDVFSDLIEMAQYLLDQKHHLSAGAIAGAVLEDALRKLCAKHGVTWQGHSAISVLNTELYKAQVYDKVPFGNVDSWGKLRNKIDHHDFVKPEDIESPDVRRMIDGVRDFIAKYLS